MICHPLGDKNGPQQELSRDDFKVMMFYNDMTGLHQKKQRFERSAWHATAHTAAATVDFHNESEVQLLPHPSCSPDLFPCDFNN